MLKPIKERYCEQQRSRQEFRRSGHLLGGLLLALALPLMVAVGAPAIVLLLVSLGLIGLAELRPEKLQAVDRAWFYLAGVLAVVLLPILLTLIYFLILTPLGLLRRLSRVDPLLPSRDQLSYWHLRRTEEKKRDYSAQF